MVFAKPDLDWCDLAVQVCPCLMHVCFLLSLTTSWLCLKQFQNFETASIITTVFVYLITVNHYTVLKQGVKSSPTEARIDYNNNNNNNNTKICKAHNVSTRVNLRCRQSLSMEDD